VGKLKLKLRQLASLCCFFFGGGAPGVDWGLYSGFVLAKQALRLLEPYLQSILLWLFRR
jgi:hypothetical protein